MITDSIVNTTAMAIERQKNMAGRTLNHPKSYSIGNKNITEELQDYYLCKVNRKKSV